MMETRNLVGMILAVTVGLICIGTVMLPILSDATQTEDVFTNDGVFYMEQISSTDEETHTLYYETDGTNAGIVFYFDEVLIDTSDWGSYTYTLATNGEWVLRASATSEYIGLQGIGDGFSFGGHNTRTITAVFDSGTVTIDRTYYDTTSEEVISAATVTGTYDELWLYSADETEYIMKDPSSSVYMLTDSEYYAVGVTTITAWNTIIEIEGTVEDFTPTIIYPPNLTTTVSNKAVVSEEVEGYEELHLLEKLTFSINDGTTTVDATYSYFIVPAEVTAELSAHFDTTQIAILMVIPVLMIIAVLLIAVRGLTRYD